MGNVLSRAEFDTAAKVVTENMSCYFPKIVSAKRHIQVAILDETTYDEIAAIRDSVYTQSVVDKLSEIAFEIWHELGGELPDLYCVSMAVGTIIKEYEWGDTWVRRDGLFLIAQNIQSVNSTPPTTSETSFKPFVFMSSCHQRYQSGQPVMGLQSCGRTISVENNTNGCTGYRLASGDGYIVKLFNDDLNRPNMSDKPMRIIKETVKRVEFRGFPIEAQTPFGWQQVSYQDYGLTVLYDSNGNVEKCVLHMFDRNIDLEYRK